MRNRRLPVKKLALYVVGFSLLFGLVGCGKNKYVFESEKPYYGIVTDCAMSVVNEGDREGRAYVIISTGEKDDRCFWLPNNYRHDAQIGDFVIIDSAIESGTNLLVATEIISGDEYVEVIKELFSVVEEEDTHGGFHGDGTYYLTLDCSQNKEVAMELINSWNAFPLSKNLQTILYGSEARSSLLAEETNIPEITNGYYYFCDRHSESTDASDDTNLFSRASYNFTLMIYDGETDRLYYVEFDT